MDIQDKLQPLKKLVELTRTQISQVEILEHEGLQTDPEHFLETIKKLKRGSIEKEEIIQRMIDKIGDGSVDLTHEEMSNMKKQIRILEVKEDENQKLIAWLKKEISGQNGRIAKLTRNIEDTKKQLENTQDALTHTRNELMRTQNDHKITQNKLEKIENALKTGQISFEFEKDLAKYIYPNGKKYGSRKIFTNMKKWLEDKKETKQGQEANERWDALKKEFSWSRKHEDVFSRLLEFRRPYAHPARDQNADELQIPDDFDGDEKERIKDIVNMIERVNELMDQS